MSGLLIEGPGFSLLPTLPASMGSGNRGGANPDGPFRPSLIEMARTGSLSAIADTHATSTNGSSDQNVGPVAARDSLILPTLTASSASRGKAMRGPNAQGGPSLQEVMLPTLCSRDEKGPGLAHTRAGSDLPQVLGGHLNPEWCLWFMGFPAGWLDVDDAHVFAHSATPSSRSVRKSSGG